MFKFLLGLGIAIMAISLLSEEAKAEAQKIEEQNDREAFETIKEIHRKKGHIIRELIANKDILPKKVRDNLDLLLKERKLT